MPFDSYCYLVGHQLLDWNWAQNFCRNKGGELVKINSAEENEFVLKLVNQQAPSLRHVWIGLKWNDVVQRFLWSDLSTPVYKNWAPNEPNGRSQEPCGIMYTRGQNGLVGYWNDGNCAVLGSVVCKRLTNN